MEATQNVVAKTYNAGIVGLSVAASIISSFMLITFLFLWVSFGHVYKNVNRRAKVHVNVNCEGVITLSNFQDPYNVFRGAAFGSQEGGINQVDCHGRFYVALPENTKYDFKTATIHGYVRKGFVVADHIECKSVTLEPFKICRDGSDYLLQPANHSYTMYLTITWEQPASL
jgi:hypothetical protein